MGTIRRFDLQEIKDKYNSKVFVETGTMYGDGVDYALQYSFDKIISIEIESSIHKTAVKKYKDNDTVNIVLGDSSKVLNECINNIDDNIIFFLDAHFPGADTDLRSYDEVKLMEFNTYAPLEKELNIIPKRAKEHKDVIIADDLWLYEEGNFGAGNMNEHAKNHNQNITKEELIGHDAKFAYNLFSKTHTIKKHYNDQGYLIFLPN